MDDKKHRKTKLTLRTIGFVLLIVGATLAIVGFVNFGNFDNNLFACAMVGLPMVAIGVGLIIFSFQKEIGTYMKNESTPVFNEMSSDIKPGISTITTTVKNAIKDDGITCDCGELNDKDAKYCSNCGKELHKLCTNCGEPINLDANFCDNCGQKVEK